MSIREKLKDTCDLLDGMIDELAINIVSSTTEGDKTTLTTCKYNLERALALVESISNLIDKTKRYGENRTI